MGIDVQDHLSPKTVTHNPAHENRVVTAVASNPSRSAVGNIPVVNVFRRTKTGDAERDGNPLMYALKGINNYTILPHWRGQIMGLAEQIVTSIGPELATYDHVLDVPSSNAFCATFATFVSQTVGVPFLPSTFIQKKTVGQMLAGFQGIPANVRRQDKKAFGRQLREWEQLPLGSIVSMKLVSPAVRPYLDPFTAMGQLPALAEQKVLIVDDLLSSGTSISSVARILRGQGATVAALCFLSGVAA